MKETSAPEPGWYPDPDVDSLHRWFDGTNWTTDVRLAAEPSPIPSALHDVNSPVDPASAQHALLSDPQVVNVAPTARTAARPGWYPDPVSNGRYRWYNGAHWTFHTRHTKPQKQDRPPRRGVPRWARRQLADVNAAIPTLTTKSRAASRTGIAALLVSVAALGAATTVWWNTMGTNMQASANQQQLVTELSYETEGDTRFDFGHADLSNVVPVPAPEGDELEEGLDAAAEAEGVDARTPAGTGLAGMWSGNSNPTFESDGSTADVKIARKPRADITPFPPAGWTPPAGRSVAKLPKKEAAAWGRIRIPAIGVDAVMVAGTSEKSLKKGPGVWRSAATPGSPGNAMVAAHRTTYGSVFARINELKYGDTIVVDVPKQPRAVYEVRGRAIVTPKNVAVTKQTGGVRLTLASCHPLNSDRFRMVVQAEMVSGAWLDQAVNRSQWQLQVR